MLGSRSGSADLRFNSAVHTGGSARQRKMPRTSSNFADSLHGGKMSTVEVSIQASKRSKHRFKTLQEWCFLIRVQT
jgi:hypothetical protein